MLVVEPKNTLTGLIQQVSCLELAQYAILVDGKPFDISNRPYLPEIYNVDSPEILLVAGRQVEKSTSIGNKIIARSIMNPNHRSVYVAPASIQVRTFSDDRLKEPLMTSPNLRPWLDNQLLKNVFEKRFATRSKVTLRSAYLTADRVRGIPADDIYIDEIQDILVDNVPIIKECGSNAPHPRFQYTGTPKTFDNTLQVYWEMSTKREWMIPCSCKSWYWNIVGVDNIGKEGLICSSCGKPIYSMNGQWVRTGMSLGDDPRTSVRIDGFRIPQLIVPTHHTPEKWAAIRHKLKTYSQAKFFNEVLGLAYDIGVKPITKEDLMRCCANKPMMKQPEPWLRNADVYAGIDWGTGDKAFSVLTIGVIRGVPPIRLIEVLFIKRYEGAEADPKVMINDMASIIMKFGCKRVGADYGFGFGLNDDLATKVRVPYDRYQYSGNQKVKIAWHKKGRRFIANRTAIMSYVFKLMKLTAEGGRGLRFFNWGEFETYSKDILGIYSEYNESLRMLQYGHSPETPDDVFHSISYMALVSMREHPRDDFRDSD